MSSSNRARIALLALAAAMLALGPQLAPWAAQGLGASAVPMAGSVAVIGEDVSWPNCPQGMGIPQRRTEGKPMPSSAAKFIVIGLTNGPGFTPNPCLASQVGWAKSHHLLTSVYAVVTYPSAMLVRQYSNAGPYRTRDWRNGLWNTGWAQAQFNLANMRRTGLDARFIWMDVEHYPVAPWSANQLANKAVFEGAFAAYRAAGLKVGIYSTGYQWRSILGTARYGIPEWHTTGQASLASAQRACGAASFQGGRTVMAQWWTSLRDYDLLCPVFTSPTAVATYFRRY